MDVGKEKDVGDFSHISKSIPSSHSEMASRDL